MKSHEVLKKSIDEIGVKEVAQKLNISTALVYKWCEASLDQEKEEARAINPLDRVFQLYKITNSRELINWLCIEAEGFFVPNPEAEKVDGIEFIQRTQVMIGDFSELLNVLTESLKNDGKIDMNESEQIRITWETLKSTAESLVIACEQGIFSE